MHCFLLKVSKNCQNLLHDLPIICDQKETIPVSLLIWGPLSLQKCFKNYISNCLLKVVYQSKNRIANVFNFKDVVNTKLSSLIVYKLMCSCCNTTCWGQI